MVAAGTGRTEALGDHLGVEAKARARPLAELDGTEIVAVLIDPAPLHFPELGDPGGRDHPVLVGVGGRLGAGRKELGQAGGQRLDRLGREAKQTVLGDWAHRRRRAREGGRGRPSSSLRRRRAGPRGCLPQWAIRAAAISR